MAGLCLCLLLLWVRYAVFWARYTPPRVNVRWSEATAPSTRQTLEVKHRLDAPRPEDGRTRSYRLADDSPAAIHRLVTDPAVEDTHNIDRRRFELAGENPPGRLEGRFWLLWAGAISVVAGVLSAWIAQDRWWRIGSTATRSAGTAVLLASRVVAGWHAGQEAKDRHAGHAGDRGGAPRHRIPADTRRSRIARRRARVLPILLTPGSCSSRSSTDSPFRLRLLRLRAAYRAPDTSGAAATGAADLNRAQR